MYRRIAGSSLRKRPCRGFTLASGTASTVTTNTSNDNRGQIDDALGGRAYYQGRIELDIPLGTGAKELGLRPSIFLDVGSVFSVKRPTLTTLEDFRDTRDGVPGKIGRAHV